MEAGASVKLNLAAGAHPLEGFVNLDKSYDGWTFESGFPDLADESVDAITESHGLMYVPDYAWGYVFEECERVLKRDGVIRITEDATDDPASERHGGFRDAVALTSKARVIDQLEAVGLTVYMMSPQQTLYHDRTLIQTWHGLPPKVFFVEAWKY